ncbi:MAG: tyrosine-type recombinase/integrase [Acidimicrobiales bacterium]
MNRRPFGRVRKLPSGRWQARYPDGLGRDVAAPTTFPTKADAALFLAKVQTEMERGEWIDPALGRITFREWAQEWLAANPAKRATTLARDRVVLNTHFLPLLGDRPLSKISPAHVKGCVDAMTAKLAPATVRTNLAVFKAVMNAAVQADRIARSPVRAIRLTSGPGRDRPTLTFDELARLAGTIPDQNRAFILIAGVLGLRWSEAVGLQVGDVDFLRRTLTVRRTISEVEGRFHEADTKTRSSRRTLSLPTFLIDEIAHHLAADRPGVGKDDLVFTAPHGGPVRRSFEGRLFKQAVEAGWAGPGPHLSRTPPCGRQSHGGSGRAPSGHPGPAGPRHRPAVDGALRPRPRRRGPGGRYPPRRRLGGGRAPSSGHDRARGGTGTPPQGVLTSKSPGQTGWR